MPDWPTVIQHELGAPAFILRREILLFVDTPKKRVPYPPRL
jgi:hypothetical protein